MKPRLLFLTHTAQLGGAELSLLDIAPHYATRCQILVFQDGLLCTLARQRGIPCEVLPVGSSLLGVSRSAGLLRSVKAMPALVAGALAVGRRARDYDLLYANSQKAFRIAAASSLITGKPLVWHLRDHLSTSHLSRFHCRSATWLANTCAGRVIANSHATREAFVEAGGRPGIVTVVHNAVDPAPFAAVDRTTVERLRQELKLRGIPTIGTFGRISPWKGQHIVIQALARLPGVHALFVGDALFGETQYLDHLRVLARRLQLRERVHFLGFRRDVPTVMGLVDVVVHASTAPEPFGRVIVEGMLARKPSIASRGGATSEIIEHGRTGLLVPPADPIALAEAIRAMLQDPHRAAAMAEQAHSAASTRFALQRLHEEIDCVLEEVLRNTTARHRTSVLQDVVSKPAS